MKIHGTAHSSPAQLLMGLEAFGLYITIAAKASHGGLGTEIPPALLKRCVPDGRVRGRLIRRLLKAEVLKRERGRLSLVAVAEDTRWIYLGSPLDASPLVAITQPGFVAARGRTPLPRALRDRVVERDGMVCGICGQGIPSRTELHIDHIEPVARGGGDELENLRPTHALCNLRKGAQVA